MNLLEVGTPAKNFTALDHEGNKIQLNDYRGKKVILYFYPKDNTSGCTTEACSLRDTYKEIQNSGAEIVGVSVDNMESHKKFVSKNRLPFKLIVDEDKSIVNAYGVYGEKSMYGKKYMGTNRITYIIDEQGNVEYVFTKVKTSDHGNEILNYLKQRKL